MASIIFIIFLLSIMEVSLSFDNAVLNATVLRNMSPKWQQRFLTWGVLVAVFGMRLIFPILIVCLASALPIMEVVNMALYDPAQYGAKLAAHHIPIAAFGGTFLLMVFLEFICNKEKEIHWLGWLEHRLTRVGLLKGIEIIIAGAVVVCAQYLLSSAEERITCLLAGFLGIALYMLIQAIMGLFDLEGGCANKRGLMAFLYLEVLDASCSLDGVIGAFAMTNNILVIMIGLGIGAFAIRSLTLYLVRGGILQQYIYLEHGAHYGIGALAMIMLASIITPISEIVTGLVGISFIGLSLLSSMKRNRALKYEV